MPVLRGADAMKGKDMKSLMIIGLIVIVSLTCFRLGQRYERTRQFAICDGLFLVGEIYGSLDTLDKVWKSDKEKMQIAREEISKSGQFSKEIVDIWFKKNATVDEVL